MIWERGNRKVYRERPHPDIQKNGVQLAAVFVTGAAPSSTSYCDGHYVILRRVDYVILRIRDVLTEP